MWLSSLVQQHITHGHVDHQYETSSLPHLLPQCTNNLLCIIILAYMVQTCTFSAITHQLAWS